MQNVCLALSAALVRRPRELHHRPPGPGLADAQMTFITNYCRKGQETAVYPISNPCRRKNPPFVWIQDADSSLGRNSYVCCIQIRYQNAAIILFNPCDYPWELLLLAVVLGLVVGLWWWGCGGVLGRWCGAVGLAVAQLWGAWE